MKKKINCGLKYSKYVQRVLYFIKINFVFETHDIYIHTIFFSGIIQAHAGEASCHRGKLERLMSSVNSGCRQIHIISVYSPTSVD